MLKKNFNIENFFYILEINYAKLISKYYNNLKIRYLKIKILKN